MQAVLLVVLGVFLCGVRGQEERDSPDLLSIIRTIKLLQTEVKTLQSLQTEVKALQSLQTKVQNLESSLAQQENRVVAFLASFHSTAENENHGPFNVATTIKYNIVQTNIGNGYNANTGIFTAPVKGLYVFHFTVFGNLSNPPSTVATLRKNAGDLMGILDKSPADPQDTATRVAVVTLEMGDTVSVLLGENAFFYAKFGLNSFSGFLLSPM